MRYFSILLRTIFAGLIALGILSGAAQAGEKQGLVLQVSDDSPAVWNQALNNAMNVVQELGEDKVQVEIVAYGPGLKMLKFDSEVNNRLTDASKKGITLAACGNTMKKTKVTAKDLHANAKVVPAGVVEIMNKQKEGWAYVKP
ncbi:MAG TPA: hypothetical protein DIC36_10295 [Gammaproteobacteria bacterium]|nr:hypothetical protein [Gammaproteobacteria bacterium]